MEVFVGGVVCIDDFVFVEEDVIIGDEVIGFDCYIVIIDKMFG